MIAWLLTLALAAGPECAPLSEAELADRIHGSLDAIHRADVAGHKAIIEDLESRLPCLDFVPSPERWAELLVGIAIVAQAQGEDWEAPLSTALRIHPGVHLLVGPTHAFRTWERPTEAPVEGRPIPAGVRIYLDGELVTEVRPTDDLRLAQRRTGDGWNTLLLRGDPIPEAWFQEPTLSSGGVRVVADLELRAGGGWLVQAVSPEGTWLDDLARLGPAIGGGFRFSTGYGDLPGVYLDGQVPRVPGWTGAYGHGGLDVLVGPLHVQAGVGPLAHRAVDGDGDVPAVAIVPVVGVGARNLEGFDASGQLGWAPGLLRLGGRGGKHFGTGVTRLRVGVDAWMQRGGWEQERADRAIHVYDGAVALTVGLAWRKAP